MRVYNAEAVFFNKQLARNGRQENGRQVNSAAHIFIGHHTRRQRTNIQFPRNSIIRVNNGDTFLTESCITKNKNNLCIT